MPTPIAPLSVARTLRRGPPSPSELLRLLSHAQVELTFRQMVRQFLADEQTAILNAGRGGGDHEANRVWAFCAAFERRYFPIYECDELDHLVYSIGFIRLGWSYDAFHDLDLRPGTLLLRTLCAEPYQGSLGARVPLLEAVENVGIPRDVLLRLPADGVSPVDMHGTLDGGPYAAAAQFADWTWGQTELAFLDCEDEMEIVDAEWSDENVQELTRQWREAKALMDRVTALETWLEQDPASHFAQLVGAALTVSSRLHERSADAQQISPGESNSPNADASIAIPAAAAA